MTRHHSNRLWNGGTYHVHKIMCGDGIWGHRCYWGTNPNVKDGGLRDLLGHMFPWGLWGIPNSVGGEITILAWGAAIIYVFVVMPLRHQW